MYVDEIRIMNVFWQINRIHVWINISLFIIFQWICKEVRNILIVITISWFGPLFQSSLRWEHKFVNANIVQMIFAICIFISLETRIIIVVVSTDRCCGLHFLYEAWKNICENYTLQYTSRYYAYFKISFSVIIDSVILFLYQFFFINFNHLLHLKIDRVELIWFQL